MEFSHPLPSMRCEGRANGLYNNPELEYPCVLTTLSPELGQFMKALRDNIRRERRMIFLDGRVLVGYLNWIRDCCYMFEMARHWEYDTHSFYDCILEHQTEKGFFFELIKQLDDEHWKMVNPDCAMLFPTDNLAFVRLELEADVEYLMVLYARRLYEVDGDLEYIRDILPRLERAMTYMLTDEKRFDPALGLVKRAYTIDTWDFTFDPASQTDRRIRLDRMAAMHGDNSGVYAALRTLAWFRRKLGDGKQADAWEQKASDLRANMKAYLWNGRFFVHQLPISGEPFDEHENERLSMSNAYDINRGVTDGDMTRAILDEYQRRRQTTDAFAEWFSIDPPYETFGGHPAGTYVNGAISPFAAGELALAALRNGRENYGYDILLRFLHMWQRDGDIYFLYARQGGSVSDGMGPSGWGAASLLKAIEEGLAGIRELDTGYRVMEFAPRWPVTEYRELRFITGYEKAHVTVDVRYELRNGSLRCELRCPSEELRLHLLLPAGAVCRELMVGGQPVCFETEQVGISSYVNAVVCKRPDETAELEARW